jgi:hypothetical protein
MGFSGGGSNVTKAHTHDSTVVQDGGSLAANVTQFGLSSGSILYSDGSNIQELSVGTGAQVMGVSGSLPAWITNTSNPLVKVTKSYTNIDVDTTSMDIYTLPQDAALVNIWTDITTVFDVSTAVTIGDAGDDNGFTEATDWTSGTGLTDATRGVYVTSFKTMRSTSGTTDIKAYNFSTTGGSGSTFIQSNTDNTFTLASPTPELCQLYQAGQVLIGEDVCKASWFIRDSAGTATGDLKAYIRQSDGTLVETSTTVLDASTVTASFVEYTFDFPATTMVADYMICIEFTGSNQILVEKWGTNIANGLCYMLESGTYVLKVDNSVTGTITYACTPLTSDTQGEVDFYLQVVD